MLVSVFNIYCVIFRQRTAVTFLCGVLEHGFAITLSLLLLILLGSFYFT